MYSIVLIFMLGMIWFSWHLLNKAIYGDAFSPFNLLLYCWVLPFGFSLSNLSGLQSGMEQNAVLIVIISTVILTTTCLFPALVVNMRKAHLFAKDKTRVFMVSPMGVIVFYFIALVALYFAEFSDRDLPLVAYLFGGVTDSNLHVAGKDSKLQVIAFGIYAAAIFIFFLWQYEKKTWRRAFYFLLAFTVIALGLAKTSKSDVYIPILSYTGLTYYYYRANKLSVPTAYKIAAVVIGITTISITAVRLQGIGLAGGYANLIEFQYSDQLGVVVSEAISIVYGYTALGFQNFSNYVSSHDVVLRMGTSLFRPFLSLIMRGDVANEMSVPVDQWNVVSDAANTGTFLTPLYIEGGPAFCFLGSLFYGAFVNLAYMFFRSTRSNRWMFVYTSLMFPWTWLFFTNAFSVLSVYVNIFYIFLLSELFARSVTYKATDVSLLGSRRI